MPPRPSLTRANALGQYLFVNGRPVRDKLILGAVRAAYADYLPRDRHPVVALFVTLDPQEVDANVHPAKTEVRFRNAGLVRALIVHALKEGLAREGKRTAANSGGARHRRVPPAFRAARRRIGTGGARRPFRPDRAGLRRRGSDGASPNPARPPSTSARRPPMCASRQPPSADLLDRPLGAARTQIHETYIVSQTRDGLIVVDQHAAHERIVYEKLKASLAKNGVQRQILLIPEIVELDEATVETAAGARRRTGARSGSRSNPSVPARSRCAKRRRCSARPMPARLLRDLAEHMAEWDEALPLERRLMHVAATMACHGSVRAGRSSSRKR